MTTFPMFPLQELIRSFSTEYNLNLMKENIKNPQSDLWIGIHTELAAKYFYLSLDNLEKKLRGVQDCSNFLLFEVGETNLKLVLLLQEMHEKSGMDDVSYFDLTRPTTARLCKILSALLNRFRFNTTYRQDIDEIRYQEELDTDVYNSLTNKIVHNETLLDSKKKEMEELEDEDEVDKKKFDECMMQCAQQVEIQEKLNFRISDFEAKLNEEDNTLMRKEEILKDLQNRLKAAESRIVKSPFRLQQTVEHYKKKLPEQVHRIEEERTRFRKEREGLKQDEEKMMNCQMFDLLSTLLRDHYYNLSERGEAVKDIINKKEVALSTLEQMKSDLLSRQMKKKKIVDSYQALINEVSMEKQDLEQRCFEEDELLKDFQRVNSKFEEYFSLLKKKLDDITREIQIYHNGMEVFHQKFQQMVKDYQSMTVNQYLKFNLSLMKKGRE